MSAIEALPRLLAGSAAVLCIALAGAEGVPQAADAVAARFPEPATVYDTPGLQPGRDRFTGNEELRQALHELAARPQGPRLLAAGRSADGTAIEALHFSRGPGRPTVLLVGQQHGDEPAGAEALLAVARLLATPAWGLVPGARADLLVLELQAPGLLGMPASHALDALVFATDAPALREVWVAGRRIVAGGRHIGAAAATGRLAAEVAANLAADFAGTMAELWPA